MAIEVFKLFGSIMVDNEKANKSLSDTDKKAEGVGNKFLSGVGKVAKFGVALGAAAAAGGAALFGLATKASETADRIDKLSNKVGLSKQGFQEWDYVMAQNGMEVEKLQSGIKTLTQQMDAAANGSKDATEAFDTLGLTWDDGTGKLKSQEQMMNESIMALAKMENGTEKARLATKLFGKAGTEMLPMLNNGAESIEELKERAHELGLVMSDDAVNAGVKLGDTIDDVKKSFGAIVTKIGVSVMPIIQKLCDWLLQQMPLIQKVLDAVFKGIEWGVTLVSDILTQFFGFLSTSLDETGITWQTVWDACMLYFQAFSQYITTIWESLGKPLFELIVSMVGWVKDIFMEYWPMISEFFNSFVQDCKTLWEEHLKPMFDAIGDFITNVLAPAFEFVFKNIIGPIVGACFKGIIDLWNNSLKPILTGVIDFITGVFSGNWSKAWEGLKNIVSGVFNGLVSLVKMPINAIIGLVNKMIGGLNTLKVPDWIPFIGGSSINIPKIPLLAKGTQYHKGGPAIVGEQGPELVSMPKGSKVTPNGETEQLLRNGNRDKLQANIYFDGRMIMRALAPFKDELDAYDLRFV